MQDSIFFHRCCGVRVAHIKPNQWQPEAEVRRRRSLRSKNLYNKKDWPLGWSARLACCLAKIEAQAQNMMAESRRTTLPTRSACNSNASCCHNDSWSKPAWNCIHVLTRAQGAVPRMTKSRPSRHPNPEKTSRKFFDQPKCNCRRMKEGLHAHSRKMSTLQNLGSASRARKFAPNCPKLRQEGWAAK